MEKHNLSRENDILPIEELFAKPDNSRKQTEETLSPFLYSPQKLREHNASMRPPPEPEANKTLETGQQPAQKTKVESQAASKPKQASKKVRPIFWAIAGFAVGVVFWHFVGFWSFIEDAVLKGPEQTQFSRDLLENSNLQKSQFSLPKDQNLVPQDHVSCIALVLDRRTKQTYSVPCKPGRRFKQGKNNLRTASRIDY